MSDWEHLRSDPGFKKLMGSVPSVDVLERYLNRLGLTEIEHSCSKGRVAYSTLLEMIHKEMVLLIYKLKGSPKNITLDFDASLFETYKKEALFCYEKVKAYQPIAVYCPELGIIVAHEMRDGNIAPQTGYDRLLSRCLDIFPKAHITFRSDSAAYQIKFLDDMQLNNVEYFVTADEFESMENTLHKAKGWTAYISKSSIRTEQEVLEIAYVPTFSSQQDLAFRRETMRFIAIRKPKTGQLKLGEHPYVYQVVVTNTKETDLNKIFHKHWGRCGSIEYTYSQLKNGCGMRKFPSGKFHVNAAWFSMGILTHNILKMLQAFVLPKELQKCEIATLRFRFMRSAATIMNRSRQTIIQICKGHSLYKLFKEATKNLEEFVFRLHQLT